MSTAPSSSALPWLKINGAPVPEIEAKISQRIHGCISNGLFTSQDCANIHDRKLSIIQRALSLDERHLQQLRRLCQLWDVNLDAGEITSHRRWIGPVIVRLKQLISPVLRAILSGYVERQRTFNAAVVEAYLESVEKPAKK